MSDGKSIAEQIALMAEADRARVLAGLDMESLEHNADFWLRPSQKEAVAAMEWLIVLLGGRGTGKTRVGSEWVREKAKVPGTRIALVGRTVSDVRDTMVQGDSGLLSVHPASDMPEYIPSLRKLIWPNGSIGQTFSAIDPSQLRGPQFHCAWGDELATWKLKPDDSGLNAWDNLQIATRLGAHPQIFLTTTPKRVPTIRALVNMARNEPHRCRLVRGSTMDNAANLAAVYLETILGKFAGTSIERQELYGELLDVVEGALWSEEQIEADRTSDIRSIPEHTITVVGVDPSVAEKPGDECGIVVAKASRESQTYKRSAWVVDDRSILGSPEVWAKRVVETAKDWQAIVVAEQNQGGALVKLAINGVDPSVPVVLVSATQGKAIRAEPVMLASEQHRVHHFGRFVELEDEMTGWVPGESGWSPNRLDAMVWALTALIVDSKALRSVETSLRASRSVVDAVLPGVTPRHRTQTVQRAAVAHHRHRRR